MISLNTIGTRLLQDSLQEPVCLKEQDLLHEVLDDHEALSPHSHSSSSMRGGSQKGRSVGRHPPTERMLGMDQLEVAMRAVAEQHSMSFSDLQALLQERSRHPMPRRPSSHIGVSTNSEMQMVHPHSPRSTEALIKTVSSGSVMKEAPSSSSTKRTKSNPTAAWACGDDDLNQFDQARRVQDGAEETHDTNCQDDGRWEQTSSRGTPPLSGPFKRFAAWATTSRNSLLAGASALSPSASRGSAVADQPPWSPRRTWSLMSPLGSSRRSQSP